MARSGVGVLVADVVVEAYLVLAAAAAAVVLVFVVLVVVAVVAVAAVGLHALEVV